MSYNVCFFLVLCLRYSSLSDFVAIKHFHFPLIPLLHSRRPSHSFRPTVPILWILLLVPRCSAGGSKEPFVCCHGIAVNYSAGPLVFSSPSQHQKSLSRTSKMACPCLKSLSHFPLVFLGLSYGLSNTLLSRLHSCASTFFFCPSPSFSLRLPFFLYAYVCIAYYGRK